MNTTNVVRARPVLIEVGGALLDADFSVPEGAHGIVVFLHGSGSSRLSPRNQIVAGRLNRAGLATILVDLLTRPEGEADAWTAEFRYDMPLLSARTAGIVDWVDVWAKAHGRPVGLFGGSTGAALALIAAAQRPRVVRAVVSRGGRPDLAEGALELVRAPTLLIVGDLDQPFIDINGQVLARLGGSRELCSVADATHLFEEPGALDQVAELATDWFLSHFALAS